MTIWINYQRLSEHIFSFSCSSFDRDFKTKTFSLELLVTEFSGGGGAPNNIFRIVRSFGTFRIYAVYLDSVFTFSNGIK